MSQNLSGQPSQPVGVTPLGVSSSQPPIGAQANTSEIIHVDVTPTEPLPEPLPIEFKNRRGQARLENITVDAIELFLTRLSQTGQWYKSAEQCGLSYNTIRRLKKEEPEFAEMCDEMMESYRDSLVAEAHRRAVDGWDEPVFSQRLGTQIGTVRKYDPRLLELLLKRHIPEFREKFEGEIKVSGGVLVAPVAAASLEEWAKQNADASYQLAAPAQQAMLPGGDVSNT